MQVILQLIKKNIENIVYYSEEIKVKPGFARNYLIPMIVSTQVSEKKLTATV